MNNFENVERIVQDSQYYLDRNDKAKYILSHNLTDEEKTLAFLLLDNKIDSTLPFIEHTKAMSNQHIPWPDIRQFHQVRKDVQWRAQFTGKFDADENPIMDRTAVAPKLMFEGTVKLHGSNAAVQLHKDGSFVCQSRERIITPLADNAGFARFVETIPVAYFDSLKELFPENWEVVAVFGEWAGPGIQKGVALTQLPNKSFFIFGAKVGNDEDSQWLDVRNWPTDESRNIFNIYNYPTFQLEIDFEAPDHAINRMNEITLEVEKECPVGKAFGHSGVGEGVVWRSITPGWESSRYWYKVKGQEHANSKVKKLASVDIEKLNSIKEFISKVLDEERLEQGITKLKEANIPVDEKATGDYIRWVVGDVNKECQDEMAQFDISDKNLGKVISSDARKWFFQRIQQQ